MLLHTLPYFAFAALMLVVLAIFTLKERRKTRTPIGYSEDTLLARKARAHGNFSEYTPFFLLLLAAYELNGGRAEMVHGFGIIYFAVRIAHAYGLIVDEPRKMPFKGMRDFIFHIRGMQITFFCLVTLAMLNLWEFGLNAFAH